MALTKVPFSLIQQANNVSSTTVGGSANTISLTFDSNGVITAAANGTINGAGITANTIANSSFQTGSVENYLNSQSLNLGKIGRAHV